MALETDASSPQLAFPTTDNLPPPPPSDVPAPPPPQPIRRFRPYTTRQLFLPVDLEDLIPTYHVVRLVNDAVDRLEDAVFESAYPGGGRPPYHPKLMAKILVYAYTQQLYSSRRIAKAVREQIPFLWLTGRQAPDFRTINRFRGERMKAIVDDVFTGLLKLLLEAGYVKLESYFVDGTKMEANANRFTHVWRKNAERYQASNEAAIQALLEHIEAVATQENAAYGSRDLEEVDPHALQPEALERLFAAWTARWGTGAKAAQAGESTEGTSESVPAPNAAEAKPAPPPTAPAAEAPAPLASDDCDQPAQPADVAADEGYTPAVQRDLRRVMKQLRVKFARWQQYRQQLKQLGDRNSYSKTDPDATFMRMKDDLLRPAYNVQIGTENQFIVGFSVHQRPGDTRCLIPHLDHVRALLGKLPQTIVADAGYGSEENYAYLEKHRRTAVVQYNTYRLERTKKFQADIKRVENWTYHADEDTWECKAGKRLTFIRETEEPTETGYRVHVREYRATDCPTCPLRAQCTTAQYRTIRVSPPLLRYKQAVRDRLATEEGRALKKRRGVEVESVFGQIKEDRHFRRFLLRGLAKVHTEWGLLSIAHNFIKQAMGRTYPA